MKLQKTLLCGLSVLAINAVSAKEIKKLPKLTNQVDSVSYALGYLEAQQYLNQFSNEGFPFDTLNIQLFAKAFEKSNLQSKYIDFRKEQFDTISAGIYKQAFMNQLTYNRNGIFTDSIADIVLQTKYNEVHMRAEAEKMKEIAKKIEGEKQFLVDNSKKAGVSTTPSGLQYEILTAGTGAIPSATDQVKCHYVGSLLDGTVFDSSVERGEPIDVSVDGVIKGWTEALQLMPVGSKWKLYIPSELGYGDKGAGNVIPPHATLIFEVELLSIN